MASSYLLNPVQTEADRRVVRLTYQAIQEVSRDAKLVPRAAALQTAAIQAAIEWKVAAAMFLLQPEFAAMAEWPAIAAIRAQVTERLIVGTIDLPHPPRRHHRQRDPRRPGGFIHLQTDRG